VGARAEAPHSGGGQRSAVDRLDPVGAALLRERDERALAAGGTHVCGARRVPGQLGDRGGERLRVAGGYEEAGAAVLDDLPQAADVARDDWSATLHGLERDHPETLAERRHDDHLGPLEDRCRRRDPPEEGDDVLQAEPGDRRPEIGLERPVAGQLERDLREAIP